jgi:hypothetical protein
MVARVDPLDRRHPLLFLLVVLTFAIADSMLPLACDDTPPSTDAAGRLLGVGSLRIIDWSYVFLDRLRILSVYTSSRTPTRTTTSC